MNFYASKLPRTKITKLVLYGENHTFDGENEESKILHGALSFMGQEIKFLDMDTTHLAPAFNCSASIYIDCHDEAEFDEIFHNLSQGSTVMIGAESIGHIRKCVLVTDKIGVTW